MRGAVLQRPRSRLWPRALHAARSSKVRSGKGSFNLGSHLRAGTAPIANLVEDQQLGPTVACQGALQSHGSVLGCEVVQHGAGRAALHRVPTDDGAMGEVVADHRLADAVRPDDDDVGSLANERQQEQVVYGVAINGLRPRPVEVGHRLELADLGVADAAFEAAALSLVVLDSEQFAHPRLFAELVPTRIEAMQAEGSRTGAQIVTHGRPRP